jgi:hypothetical protein
MLVAFADVEVEDSGLQRAVAVAVGGLGIQIQAWAHEGSEAQTWVLVDFDVQEHRAAY